MGGTFELQQEAMAFTPRCPQPQLPIQKAKRQQMDMIAELKKKQMVKEPLIYEGKDGAIEDIISGERLFQVSRDTLCKGGLSQPGARGPPSPIVGTKPIHSTFPSHVAKLPSGLCPVS